MKKYYWFLITISAVIWIWAAINPLDRQTWMLENILVFIFVPIVILIGKYFPLSDKSYTFITIYMLLHIIGSHYVYDSVPFGYTLQDWLGSSRNMYDRFVHFAGGLLLVYPIREVFLRIADIKGKFSYYLPIELTLAIAALYEIGEWIAAIVISPDTAQAFLGMQGDVWDAQKDMLMAFIGSVVAMGLLAIIHWYKYGRSKDFVNVD